MPPVFRSSTPWSPRRGGCAVPTRSGENILNPREPLLSLASVTKREGFSTWFRSAVGFITIVAGCLRPRLAGALAYPAVEPAHSPPPDAIEYRCHGFSKHQ